MLVGFLKLPHLTTNETVMQDIWVMGKAMCLLVPFIELTVSHTSVLTILAITVERSVSVTTAV